MTDWEIRDMIATRPSEAFAYIKSLQREIQNQKEEEERIVNQMLAVANSPTPIFDETT